MTRIRGCSSVLAATMIQIILKSIKVQQISILLQPMRVHSKICNYLQIISIIKHRHKYKLPMRIHYIKMVVRIV